MADHPWPRSRKALGAISGFVDKPRRFGRTTPTARTMRRLVFTDGLGCVRAALIGGVCLPPVSRHAEEIGRPQDSARRRTRAFRTIPGRVAFGHRPHVRERAAIAANIIVNRHFIFPALEITYAPDAGGECGAALRVPSRMPSRRETYLSGESDTSTPPLMCLMGPADEGMMSKSKISVGRYSVAQAFGISTTPLIWPCTGATPRMV